MEKKVYERIQILLKEKRISPHELAKILGINPQSVYNYLAGASKAPMSFVLMVLNSFPDVSAEWLLRGNGPMQTTVQKPSTTADYVNQAAINAGIQFAAEDHYVPQTWQQAFDTLQKQLNEIKSKIQ